MQQMGGQFLYRQVADSMLIDPERIPTETTQQELTREIELHQTLFDLDHQYCVAVEGASQESNLWVPRNQVATGLTDVDLQRFKSIAWNECVVKRFLTNQSLDVSAAGASMLHIVRTLNLQWKGMEVTGLHPKVESAEKQVVMACMEHRLLPYKLDVGRVARCLRRCHHFRDYFANAVGCHVVAKTGHTPGLSKTRYTTDFDYVYKHQGLTFLHSALSKNKGLINECISQNGLDYVPRLCGLKLISNASVTLQNPPERPQIIYDNSSPRPRKKHRADDDNEVNVNITQPTAAPDQSTLLREINTMMQGMQQTLQRSIEHQQYIPQPIATPPVITVDNTGQIRDMLNAHNAQIRIELEAHNQHIDATHQYNMSTISTYFSQINDAIQNQNITIEHIAESIQNPNQTRPPQQPPPIRPPAAAQPAVAEVHAPIRPPAAAQPAADGPLLPISPPAAARSARMWPSVQEIFARWRHAPDQAPAAAPPSSDSDESESPLLSPPISRIPLQHEPIKKPPPARRASVHGSRQASTTTPPQPSDDDADMRSITSLLD